MDPAVLDLVKALAPFIAAVVATVGAAARWVVNRNDLAEEREKARYDALLARLDEAAKAREAYHTAESERQRADAKAMVEAITVNTEVLRRNTSVIEAVEPRLSGTIDTDPRRRTR